MSAVSTTATRHAPYGMGRAGRLLHRCARVTVEWGDDGIRGPRNRPRLRAEWLCGFVTPQAVLFTTPPPETDRCRFCHDDLPSSGERVVYFAERNGLVKIGTTINPALRMRALGAHLLAVEPGGFVREARLHARFADDHDFGEWFRPSGELLGYIDGLKAPA